MARRETILRDDNDGGLRQHEVEIRTYSARAEGKEEIILDAESWYRAREQARMAFGTEHVTVEEVVEGITQLTGDVVAPSVVTPEPIVVTDPAILPALERLQRRARGQ
jgi:hypothetical protein